MTVKFKKQIACYVTPGQHAQLQRLSKETRVPMQAYLREAVDLLLKKYRKRARG
jgi:hypothetical protein